MKRVLKFAPFVFLLTGCGGGGGNSQITPATAYRASGPGDSWTYDVTIDFGIFGQYGGTLTEALAGDTYDGQTAIRDTRTFNLQLQTGPATITSYSEVGANGALLGESVNGVLTAVTSDTFAPPSTFAPNEIAKGTVTLESGETINETYSVVGVQAIKTAAGSFNCWVVTETVSRSDNSSDKFTLWIAPETGNYVQMSDATVNSDGSTYNYTASLKSLIAVSAGEKSLRTIQPATIRYAF